MTPFRCSSRVVETTIWWNHIKTMFGSERLSAGITGKEYEGTSWMMVMMGMMVIRVWVAQIRAFVKTH